MQKLARICQASIRRSQSTCVASSSTLPNSKCFRQYSTQNPGAKPTAQEQRAMEDRRREQAEEYPNLLTSHPYYDSFDTEELEPLKNSRHRSRIISRNDPSMFVEQMTKEVEAQQRGQVASEDDEEEIDFQGAQGEDDVDPLKIVPLTRDDQAALHKYDLLVRRITQQTGKGKIHRMYVLTVVGNGDGLVGYGEGKDDEIGRAKEKAYAQALRNMDWVERFEKRTIFTEMHAKLGSTQIILRPRPVGFGLATNPNIHQILKAAGIKDCSAKVWGSRNRLNVIKTLFRMLQAGNAPLSMGDGFGGRARRLDAGSGVRGRGDVERERGRKLVDLRTW
ncbi:hypothetical protein GLOTRDRAFT_112184 [Gloeophyllum trabeum ATCC 11539]|uniref:Small ribosomal subunit protein uS5m n=1 Tax=Gloeophyllum trabeum (strain ATCC 11539 / FP-39264 / Madison 617) TaxID=670483 RepID=S7RHT8_GLOTA|nr:uncharacterized protein GLOTRDRAFT_112184 [Gloeophyllum trabeum ATCC 11539]EPQ52159.1 hypothetical protein GLOTRDRAFT_112184 [Gloeophyllum trabeum ATCC 11539]